MNDKTPITLHKCPFCGDEFCKRAACTKHIKTHENERDVYTIYLCPNPFKWQFKIFTRRVPNDYKEANVERSNHIWHVDAKCDEASVLDAKKRLKSEALRYYRAQAAYIAKLEIEESNND